MPDSPSRSRTRRSVLAGLAAGSIAGCLRMTGTNEQESPATEAEQEPSVNEAAVDRRTAGRQGSPTPNGTAGWTVSLDAAPTTTPLLRDGTAYVGSTDHNLYAINVATGETQFATDLGEEVGPGLTYADGVVYGSSKAGIFAIDAETGERLFLSEERYTGFGINTPLVRDGRLYYDSGGWLVALNAETGERHWQKRTVSGGSRPALAGGTLVTSDAGDVDGLPNDRSRVYGLDPADGTTRWQRTVTADALVSPVAVAPRRGLAVLVGRYGMTAAFDGTSGEEIWRVSVERDGNVPGRPLIRNGTVFVPLGNNGLYAYNLADGSERWSRGGRNDDSLALGYEVRMFEDRLVTGKSRVYEIAPSSGEVLATHTPNPPVVDSLLPALTGISMVYPATPAAVRKVPLS